ncbi:MAG: ribosome biogenesis GTP-binding protein YihA/YsxC [Eubacteriales bacterium]|nr:ribosome biogenesis GTP-binding protein YihA/YsxC [Eubacteriales bacterium]MDD3880856.1 ribosome biogenesis GTP-binding protein YihA/YsxC [Eubacteriales bacterium]MDD4511777.1 ribosome biogenesis GTP-binding protein YihA/YsxC [Eubacteriales bacterium]
MEISKASFLTSMADWKPPVAEPLSEIAVAGRSNVGKSSLINKLCNRRGLAKTSSTPGKTRLINYFTLTLSDKEKELKRDFYLVDLPGYGYANVSKDEKLRWGRLMQSYFDKSEKLLLTLMLVDIRHEPTRDDLDMIGFLRQKGLPYRVIATKADKLSRAQVSRALLPISRALQVQPFDIIVTSAESGDGIPALASAINDFLE